MWFVRCDVLYGLEWFGWWLTGVLLALIVLIIFFGLVYLFCLISIQFLFVGVFWALFAWLVVGLDDCLTLVGFVTWLLVVVLWFSFDCWLLWSACYCSHVALCFDGLFWVNFMICLFTCLLSCYWFSLIDLFGVNLLLIIWLFVIGSALCGGGFDIVVVCLSLGVISFCWVWCMVV